MRLFVTMVDYMPVNFGCQPMRRIVEVDMTPEQTEKLRPRHVGKSCGIEQYEHVEMCVLQEGNVKS